MQILMNIDNDTALYTWDLQNKRENFYCSLKKKRVNFINWRGVILTTMIIL